MSLHPAANSKSNDNISLYLSEVNKSFIFDKISFFRLLAGCTLPTNW
jgi:hypothetical protein